MKFEVGNIGNRNKIYFQDSIPSVLTLTVSLLREEWGGGAIREGGLLKISTSRQGGLLERGALFEGGGVLELLR